MVNKMEEEGFGWWKNRLGKILEQFDQVRIDHFRGFEGCWAIPASEPSAVVVTWKTGPGKRFFTEM